MKGLIKISLISLFILTISSCGLQLIPKTTNEGTVDLKANSITIEKDRIKITAMGMEWKYSPYYLEDYYTPIYVIVRNETEKEVDLKYEDFMLLDDKGNQFRVIRPEQVKDSVPRWEDYNPYWDMPRPYYYWDYGWWRPYRYTPWSYTYPYNMYLPPYPYYYNYNYPYSYPYDMYDLTSDVIPQALNEGKILPKAQVRGFLYFQKATEYGNDITLRVSLLGLTYNFTFEIKRRGDSGY